MSKKTKIIETEEYNDENQDKDTKIEKNKIIPQLLPLEKSYHQQLNDIKMNIIKIFTNRGHINKENMDKYIKKFIEDENDDMEFIRRKCGYSFKLCNLFGKAFKAFLIVRAVIFVSYILYYLLYYYYFLSKK